MDYNLFFRLIENPNSPTVAEIFKAFPCCVCKASSSGVHFGAITCEGCKVLAIRKEIFRFFFISYLNLNFFSNRRAFSVEVSKREHQNAIDAWKMGIVR